MGILIKKNIYKILIHYNFTVCDSCDDPVINCDNGGVCQESNIPGGNFSVLFTFNQLFI